MWHCAWLGVRTVCCPTLNLSIDVCDIFSPQRPLLASRRSCRRFNLVTQIIFSLVPESWTPARVTVTANRTNQRTQFINHNPVTVVQTQSPFTKYSSSTSSIASVSKTQISYIQTRHKFTRIISIGTTLIF